MKKYDIVIVGSGIGLSFVNEALNHGLSCALIERSKFGGTCLTRGCIPSKILAYPADIIRQAEHAAKIGLIFNPPDIDWELISKRMWRKIDSSKDIEKSVEGDIEGLDVFKGTAEFTDDYTMRVRLNSGGYTDEFMGDKFIIAAGARSFVPPIDGLNETDYITSENFFGNAFPKKPWSSLTIIGGGAIGAEFAHIFSAFGTKVSVVEMTDRLIPTEEPEICEFVKTQFEEIGINVYLNSKAYKAESKNGLKHITIETADGTKTISSEEILISTGVIPNTDILQIKNTSIETDKRGWIVTNEYLETNVENIWALGDINGKFQFRHKANYEARILSQNLFGDEEEKQSVVYDKVPWAIFTHPQTAHVGLTEDQALKKHKKILVGKNHYSSVAKGYAMGYEPESKDDGFVKLIASPGHKIIGAHIVGPYAAMLIHSFIYLMNAGFSCTEDVSVHSVIEELNKSCMEGGTFYPMYDTMVIHPSLSEVAGWILGKLHWVERDK